MSFERVRLDYERRHDLPVATVVARLRVSVERCNRVPLAAALLDGGDFLFRIARRGHVREVGKVAIRADCAPYPLRHRTLPA